jgi:hypothetical protein
MHIRVKLYENVSIDAFHLIALPYSHVYIDEQKEEK